MEESESDLKAAKKILKAFGSGFMSELGLPGCQHHDFGLEKAFFALVLGGGSGSRELHDLQLGEFRAVAEQERFEGGRSRP